MIRTAVISQDKTQNVTSDLMQIIAGSLLITLCAQIKIPLGFTPVPLCPQTLAVMMIGGVLGTKRGVLAVLLYIVQIAIGMPVIAGGVSNPLALIGPTAGYIFGYGVQAYLVGWCAERTQNCRSAAFLFSIFAISFIQMGLGALWLGLFVGFDNALAMGFYPFLPGDVLKCIAAVSLIDRFTK